MTNGPDGLEFAFKVLSLVGALLLLVFVLALAMHWWLVAEMIGGLFVAMVLARLLWVFVLLPLARLGGD